MIDIFVALGVGFFLGFCVAMMIAVSKEEKASRNFVPRTRKPAPEPAHRNRVKTNAPNNGERIRVRAAEVRGKYRRKI